MRLRHAPALAVLWAAAALGAAAAPPDLEIPAEVRPAGQYARLTPKTTAKSVAYVGLDGVDPVPSDLLKDPRLFLLDTRGLRPGRYRFAAVGALGDEQSRADFAVVVGDPPPGPNPPDPGPGPNPPGDVPFAGAPGLRVLIVLETADQTRYPADVRQAIFGKDVRDYLRAKCPADEGGFYGWAVWDQNDDVSGAPKAWQDAFKRPRKSLPWAVVSNGKQFYEGPVTADFLSVLKKYGG